MDRPLYQLFKLAKEHKSEAGKGGVEKKRRLELVYLKAVLASDYAKTRLELENFQLDSIQEAEDLNPFETLLEKACYHVEKKPWSESVREQFIKDFKVLEYDLTSYDLEGRNRNEHQSPESKDRFHTRLWKKFWDNDSSIRLNPEITIRRREADTELERYLERRERKDGWKRGENFSHRRLQERRTASFTLSLNAGERHPKLAFAEPEAIRQAINEI